MSDIRDLMTPAIAQLHDTARAIEAKLAAKDNQIRGLCAYRDELLEWGDAAIALICERLSLDAGEAERLVEERREAMREARKSPGAESQALVTNETRGDA